MKIVADESVDKQIVDRLRTDEHEVLYKGLGSHSHGQPRPGTARKE